MKKLFLFLLAGVFTFISCKNSQLVRPGDPINVSFQKGMDKFEAEKYGDAADIFDIITRIGRGTNFAQDAQYLLGESYYRDGRYILAVSEYQRFISFYPRDPRREEVDFKIAMSVYEQSPRYRLDQTATRQAIEAFQLFNSNYPNSEYVLQSAEKIDELRNKLAHKTFESGEFYARTGQFRAATIYFGLVIDKYPESDWAERALVRQVTTFNQFANRSVVTKQVERYESAITAYEKFIQLFPNSKYRGEVEKERDNAEQGIKDTRKLIADMASNQTN